MSEILRFDRVSKFFPGVVANDQVSLTVEQGEIHSLLGENGAGKSTLMNILYGLYKADEGQIWFEGQPVNILSPNDALKHGIGMIHQHFMLIPNFSVWENVTLGQRSGKGIVIPEKERKEKVAEIAQQLHLKLDLEQPVSQLSVGMQQKVEILKAIYRGARLLILDEPTSVLTPQESGELFTTLRRLKQDGCTIIFISHKLNEVLEISDRVSVLRDGKLIETRKRETCTPEILTTLMVGRDVSLRIARQPAQPGEVLLEVQSVSASGETYASTLKDISFRIHAGEIVGIAGVDGNGQDVLARVIAGIQRPNNGTVRFGGVDVTGETVRMRSRRRFSYIPADRRGEGLVLDFKLYENAAMTQYYDLPFSRRGLLKFGEMRRRTAEYIRDFRIKAPNTEVAAANLSGGNQQKLVLAREIMKLPDILLVVQPTWGLDIGACEFVYRKLVEERDRGAAVLLISTDLEEVRSLSDRLLVLFEGHIMGEVDPATEKVENIGQLMAGSNIPD